ncbi:hypothetical protein B0H14DRAFT_2576898 [Mycena olivaceomarginata]|nr:hypothetical protein B0H14DRAFT_2576898 [Mycena olivaceomarginata]
MTFAIGAALELVPAPMSAIFCCRSPAGGTDGRRERWGEDEGKRNEEGRATSATAKGRRSIDRSVWLPGCEDCIGRGMAHKGRKGTWAVDTRREPAWRRGAKGWRRPFEGSEGKAEPN